MSKSDSRKTVIDIINEVRRLLGYSTVTKLDSDQYAQIHLRLLNKVVATISDKGDWLEQQRTATVTAATSTVQYSLGITEPVKRIAEISFDDDGRALEPIPLEKFNRYSRGGGSGRPRFFTLKSVDSQGNPYFNVHPQPVSAQAGLLFSVEYYAAPRLYDLSSVDDEVPFSANVVIAGLYYEALLEQAGGAENRESLTAKAEFEDMRNEALNRWRADTGTDTYFQPVAR